jgi:His-Xaa-Ser system protein HxsD
MPKKKILRAPASKRRPIPSKSPASKSVKPAAASGTVSLDLDARTDGPEPILGAAYLMMDRAYALVSGDARKSMSVTLKPKEASGAAGLASLKKDFELEYAAQKVRWAVARNNRSVREYVAENALALAKEFSERPSAAEPAAEKLTAEQSSEIERLIAEVEAEITQMNAKKELPDEKGKSLSWEAAQKTEKGGGGA